MPVHATVYATVQANRDLERIGDYIARENPLRAVSFLTEIAERAALFARNPGMGADRADLLAGIRSFLVLQYVICYRRHLDGIQLVRVMHGRRDRTGETIAHGLGS